MFKFWGKKVNSGEIVPAMDASLDLYSSDESSSDDEPVVNELVDDDKTSSDDEPVEDDESSSDDEPVVDESSSVAHESVADESVADEDEPEMKPFTICLKMASAKVESDFEGQISLFLHTDKSKIPIGTLNTPLPMKTFDLLFDNTYSLSHDSQEAVVHFTGYRSRKRPKRVPSKPDPDDPDLKIVELKMPRANQDGNVAAAKKKKNVGASKKNKKRTEDGIVAAVKKKRRTDDSNVAAAKKKKRTEDCTVAAAEKKKKKKKTAKKKDDAPGSSKKEDESSDDYKVSSPEVTFFQPY